VGKKIGVLYLRNHTIRGTASTGFGVFRACQPILLEQILTENGGSLPCNIARHGLRKIRSQERDILPAFLF